MQDENLEGLTLGSTVRNLQNFALDKSVLDLVHVCQWVRNNTLQKLPLTVKAQTGLLLFNFFTSRIMNGDVTRLLKLELQRVTTMKHDKVLCFQALKYLF